MKDELRDWLEDGLSILTSRVPFVVMSKERFGEQLRDAFELGVDSDPARVRARRSAPLTPVRHLHAVREKQG